MAQDFVSGSDRLAVGVLAAVADGARGTTQWQIDRWDVDQTAWTQRRLGRAPSSDDFARLAVAPYETSDVAGNLVTTAGLNP